MPPPLLHDPNLQRSKAFGSFRGRESTHPHTQANIVTSIVSRCCKEREGGRLHSLDGEWKRGDKRPRSLVARVVNVNLPRKARWSCYDMCRRKVGEWLRYGECGKARSVYLGTEPCMQSSRDCLILTFLNQLIYKGRKFYRPSEPKPCGRSDIDIWKRPCFD